MEVKTAWSGDRGRSWHRTTPHGLSRCSGGDTDGAADVSMAVGRNGRFYLYVTVQHDDTHPGKAIGVAVADNPLGPFKDARGSALITDASTPSPYGWHDIDPTVFMRAGNRY